MSTLIIVRATQLKESVSCPKCNYKNEISLLKTNYLLELFTRDTRRGMIPLFACRKKSGKTQGNTPHTNFQLWVCPRPFIYSSRREGIRKEERNNFPRHRRELEVKFNLNELYSYQIDWFGKWIEQIDHLLGGSGDKPHFQLCSQDFWQQINAVNSVQNPAS